MQQKSHTVNLDFLILNGIISYIKLTKEGILATSDLIELLTLIFTVLISVGGGVFALVQWQKARRVRRAEFIEDILNKLRNNSDFVKIMKKIDYGEEWYDDNFHGSDLESCVDSLLTYLSYICYLKDRSILTSKEFELLSYEIGRVCVSFSVREYLWNIYHFSEKNKTTCSFYYLIKYMLENVMTEEQKAQFLNNESVRYTKRLNF